MIRTALAFIKYDLAKFMGILAGIVISVFLIGQQLGIFNSMMSSMRGLAKIYPQWIWVTDCRTQASTQLLSMDVRIGRELRSLPGVLEVHPIVMASASAKFADGSKLAVQILGLEGPDYIGGAQEFTPGSDLGDLAQEGAIMTNLADAPMMNHLQVGQSFTINNKDVRVVGMCKNFNGFGSSYIMTTAERARNLAGLSNSIAHAYLVKVQPGHEAEMIQQIKSVIPNTNAWLGQDLGTTTLLWMMRTSNIAVSFGMMVVFALIAGFAIVGLTLYSSVKDRIRDYGTIKAMGGDNALIRKLILWQAGIYALIGFGISAFLLGLNQWMMAGSRMEIHYPLWLVSFLILVTLSISLISSLFAMRTITKLEPVQIFRM